MPTPASGCKNVTETKQNMAYAIYSPWLGENIPHCTINDVISFYVHEWEITGHTAKQKYLHFHCPNLPLMQYSWRIWYKLPTRWYKSDISGLTWISLRFIGVLLARAPLFSRQQMDIQQGICSLGFQGPRQAFVSITALSWESSWRDGWSHRLYVAQKTLQYTQTPYYTATTHDLCFQEYFFEFPCLNGRAKLHGVDTNEWSPVRNNEYWIGLMPPTIRHTSPSNTTGVPLHVARIIPCITHGTTNMSSGGVCKDTHILAISGGDSRAI